MYWALLYDSESFPDSNGLVRFYRYSSTVAHCMQAERVCPAMKEEKLAEFFTYESDLPTRGDRIVGEAISWDMHE